MRLRDKLSKLDRVWAIGRGSTHLRIYPNPGIGIGLGKGRWMSIDLHFGIRVFHPTSTAGIWRVVWKFPKA